MDAASNVALRQRRQVRSTAATAIRSSSVSNNNEEVEASKKSTSASSNLVDSNDATSSDTGPWWTDARNRSVFGVLASSFLNLLGFTMVAGPLTPALGSHFGLEIGSLFGTLTSAYPLGMLMGVFIWPSLSDRVGRRPILAFSLFGSGIGLLAQSFVIQQGGTLSNFLLARALTGIFAGSSPVSKAYLADIGAKDGKLPRYLALKDASATMAFILGPAAGGLLFDIRRRMINAGKDLTKTELLQTSGSLSFVIAISAAASLLAAVLAGSLVQENSSDLKRARRKRQNKKEADEPSLDDTAVEPEEELISCPLGRKLWAGVASVCTVSFLFNMGDSTFHAFYSAFLRNQGMSTRDLGLLFTSLACVSFGVSSTSSSAILRSLGSVLTCAVGLTLVGSGLFLLGLIASGILPASFAISAIAAAIYFCGVPIYGPTIPTMLLRCVPPHRRGFVLGLDGSTNTLARILAPLIMGEVYRRYDAGMAFSVAGVSVILGAAIALFRRYTTLNRKRETT
ncbi:major facilitator superfamily transporter [Nitzschia inconspicua]|uniref:Major facilitator superfamily transporter n=1 Tax=Nitzschia inconspicua TaxID=303405 RepID=A0A9K3KV29_9STRA|nr:major facilitator superfamily transporter [Nitzschia inconspicua]